MTPDPDRLAATMPADTQRQAAHIAQDAFATVFRLTVDAGMPGRDAALAEVEQRCRNWCAAGDEKPVGGMAEEATQQLFATLSQSLPPERYQAIHAVSGQAVLAWKRARRPAS